MATCFDLEVDLIRLKYIIIKQQVKMQYATHHYVNAFLWDPTIIFRLQ